MMIVVCGLYGLLGILEIILIPIAYSVIKNATYSFSPIVDISYAGVLILAIILTLIPLAWVGPMTAAAKKHIHKTEPAIGLGVCTIIFIGCFALLAIVVSGGALLILNVAIFVLGLISGIFLLINKE